ncbi:MAG: UDP-N-acetylmuramoyl-L-alanine--D-glutamate ligase [Firmicutes bacterium]|nr:UDP-N-acetylmuramoyl-L-alanine--D-glutamate ligase [Bacillota bacterium]
MYHKIVEELKDKKVAILGFGVEGKSTYNFIRKYLPNQIITIIDKNDVSTLEMLQNDNNIDFVMGDDYLNNLDIYDLIIKSPGITFKDIETSNIREKITSQLELLLKYYKNNVIGITGTKGKSTTSTLLYEVLKSQRENVFLLGNIGNPTLDDIDKFNDDSILVVEMSSHQLEFINTSPHYGVILNLFQDHLDHAGSVNHYHDCKMNMFKYQTFSDIGVYCLDNDTLADKIKDNSYFCSLYKFTDNSKLVDDKTIYIEDDYIVFNGEKLYNINDERKLLGIHNLKNIMVVLLFSKLFNLDLNKTIETINSFKGLSHRMENIGTFNSITYYSDTIATIPEATIAAINSLKRVNTLIFGGMDRGIDYNDFIEFLNKCDVENIICMPTTGMVIGKKLNNNKNIYFVETLEEAVSIAAKVTKKDMICLLSPAAPSYEYYKNFLEKGYAYQNIVKNHYK